MDQFLSFVKSGYSLREKHMKEQIMATAIGAQGDTKTIQSAIKPRSNQDVFDETSNIKPDEFIKKYQKGKK